MTQKNEDQKAPVIFRSCSHDLMKAITVYVAHTCKYKTITAELMLFVVEVVADLCEGKVARERTKSDIQMVKGGGEALY